MSEILQPFFDIVGPFLLGQAPHDQTVKRLYGDEAAGAAKQDAERLAIYGRFCRTHRHQALTVFSETQRAIVAALGEPAWDALVERYFVAHPMHHFELNQNAASFPEFLAACIDPAAAADAEPALALPPFVAELADFEWCQWQVMVAPDAPEDAADPAATSGDPAGDRGPLRLASTVDVRPYQHDLVSWLDSEDDARDDAPAADPSLVIFWRDRSLAPRRDHAQPRELVIVKALLEGIAIDAALAAQLGLPWADLQETLADLHTAGIVLGERPAAPPPAGS